MPENINKLGKLQYDLLDIEEVLEGQTRNLFLAKLAGQSIDLFAVKNDLPITAVAQMNKEGLAKLRRAKRGRRAVENTVTLQSHEPSRQSDAVPEGSDWRARAECRFEDPELFFPFGTSGPAIAQANDAKIVCERCPVTTNCLSWALETNQQAGIWGGMTEDERYRLKRKNARSRRK